MTDYVVGFMREALSERIIMVRKGKPLWQAGLLNGVGGKVDKQVPKVPAGVALAASALTGVPLSSFQGDTRLETPIEAMVREFFEETGIVTKPSEWRLVLYMNDPRDFYTGDQGGTVYWFAATRRFLPILPPRVLDSGEELLTVRGPDLAARTDVLASPKWIVPMAFGDHTLEPLGCDDDVRANARAAGTVPKFNARAYIAESVRDGRGGNARAAPGQDKESRIAKLAERVLAPDVRFPDPLSTTSRNQAMARLMATRGASAALIEAVTGIKPRRVDNVDGGVVPPKAGTNWKGTLQDMIRAADSRGGEDGFHAKPGKVVPQVRAADDSEPPKADLHGCKEKFVYAKGTPLCSCRDGGCEGTGMAPTNLALAQAKQSAPDSALKSALASTGDPLFAVGDPVKNNAGTESGIVLAIDGPAAWVRSRIHKDKRVTLYVADLQHDLVELDRMCNTALDRAVGRLSGGRIHSGNAPHGVVMVNGRLREHNGRSLGRAVNIIPDPGPGKEFVDYPFDPRARPINTRSVGLDGHDRVVPHEPLARPDAPHVQADPGLAGQAAAAFVEARRQAALPHGNTV